LALPTIESSRDSDREGFEEEKNWLRKGIAESNKRLGAFFKRAGNSISVEREQGTDSDQAGCTEHFQ
jgi:hypothetical protein